MATKYGSVFVTEGENETENQSVPVLFSNLDFKLYDKNGDYSPFNNKLKDTSFSIRFNLSQVDEDGNHFEFEGKFRMPCQLGEMEHQDFEGVPNSKKDILEFLKRHKLVSDSDLDGFLIMRKLQSSSFIAAICPGWKISEMPLLAMSLDALFILDDYMDKEMSQINMDFKQALHFREAISSVLDGKALETGSLAGLPDVFQKVVNVMIDIRQQVLKKGSKTLDSAPLLNSYKEHIHAVCLEGCREWKEKESTTMFQLAQQELRLLTSAVILGLEMILFDQGINITQTVRTSFLFNFFLKSYTQQASLVNDLMSLKKEIKDGMSCNAVYLRYKRDGLKLQEAMEWAVEEINRLTQLICDTGEMLTSLYDGEVNVVELVKIVKSVIHGNMQWYGITERYHPDMVYDCFIRLN